MIPGNVLVPALQGTVTLAATGSIKSRISWIVNGVIIEDRQFIPVEGQVKGEGRSFSIPLFFLSSS